MCVVFFTHKFRERFSISCVICICNDILHSLRRFCAVIYAGAEMGIAHMGTAVFSADKEEESDDDMGYGLFDDDDHFVLGAVNLSASEPVLPVAKPGKHGSRKVHGSLIEAQPPSPSYSPTSPKTTTKGDISSSPAPFAMLQSALQEKSENRFLSLKVQKQSEKLQSALVPCEPRPARTGKAAPAGVSASWKAADGRSLSPGYSPTSPTAEEPEEILTVARLTKKVERKDRDRDSMDFRGSLVSRRYLSLQPERAAAPVRERGFLGSSDESYEDEARISPSRPDAFRPGSTAKSTPKSVLKPPKFFPPPELSPPDATAAPPSPPASGAMFGASTAAARGFGFPGAAPPSEPAGSTALFGSSSTSRPIGFSFGAAAPPPAPPSGALFRPTSGSGFGAAAPKPSGGPPPASNKAIGFSFGGPPPPPPSGPPPRPLLSGAAPPPFAGPPPPPPSGGMFGSQAPPSTALSFGTAAPAPPPPPPSGGLFGSQAAPAPTTGFGFGTASPAPGAAPPPPPPPSGGLFFSQVESSAPRAGFGFGAAAPQSASAASFTGAAPAPPPFMGFNSDRSSVPPEPLQPRAKPALGGKFPGPLPPPPPRHEAGFRFGAPASSVPSPLPPSKPAPKQRRQQQQQQQQEAASTEFPPLGDITLHSAPLGGTVSSRGRGAPARRGGAGMGRSFRDAVTQPTPLDLSAELAPPEPSGVKMKRKAKKKALLLKPTEGKKSAEEEKMEKIVDTLDESVDQTELSVEKTTDQVSWRRSSSPVFRVKYANLASRKSAERAFERAVEVRMFRTIQTREQA